ncbi:hypothetical protein Peur_017780 [Populus x canadensis]
MFVFLTTSRINSRNMIANFSILARGREDGNAKLARLRSLQIVVNKLSEELYLPIPVFEWFYASTGIQLDARSPD